MPYTIVLAIKAKATIIVVVMNCDKNETPPRAFDLYTVRIVSFWSGTKKHYCRQSKPVTGCVHNH